MGVQTVVWVLTVAIGLVLCGLQPAIASTIDDNKAIVAKGNNTFATELYEQLKAEPGNLLFSPYSLSTALTMTYAGACGNTEVQMANVLHLDLEPQQVHQAAGAWMSELNTASNAQKGYQLYAANALWGQEEYTFLPQFTELLKAYYNAELTPLNFASAPQESGKVINAWVKQQTQGKIPELINPATLDSSTVLVLTNAIYFKGRWALPFEKEKTQDAPFILGSGNNVDVPMMRQTADVFYFEDDSIQMVEFPYEQPGDGVSLSMLFLLPREPANFAAIEASLSVEFIESTFEKMQKQKVSINIPRFTVSSTFSLPDALKALGMDEAFSLPPADFSGITGAKDLYISDVLHKVFLEVNEEGSEAAGASAVMMSRGLARHPVFQADHPFWIVIRENSTGGFLFFGRIMDPRG